MARSYAAVRANALPRAVAAICVGQPAGRSISFERLRRTDLVRRARATPRGSWPRSGPCRAADVDVLDRLVGLTPGLATVCSNGYRFTTTRSIGRMPCAASLRACVGEVAADQQRRRGRRDAASSPGRRAFRGSRCSRRRRGPARRLPPDALAVPPVERSRPPPPPARGRTRPAPFVADRNQRPPHRLPHRSPRCLNDDSLRLAARPRQPPWNQHKSRRSVPSCRP